MTDKQDPLTYFNPTLAAWFSSRYAHPSLVQRLAWPKIQQGHHCLITAPTGSGKTLAAFLWAIDRLLQKPTGGGNRILYISPLKALNSDIEINLRQPLREIVPMIGEAGREIRVAVRSGDTTPSDRRQQERHPADIFITTPESLAVLMCRESWPAILSGFSTVIVDEVHSLVGNKRGAMLMGLLELLDLRNGPCQRLALSATVRPLAGVAAWFAGYERHQEGEGPIPRAIEIISADHDKALEIVLDRPRTEGNPFYAVIGDWLLGRFGSNRGVLLFANSRRQVERTARLINEKDDTRTLVHVHHGSLSREIRKEVETGFKEGRIRVVAATHSLELGIDIGSVDQVVLLGTPFSVASTLQRIGRSGHRLDSVSRGLLIPWHRLDHLYARVMADMALAGEIETVVPMNKPLDVLAQLLLTFMAAGIDQPSEMFQLIRKSGCFVSLELDELNQVLELLAGRIHGVRHSSLVARIHADIDKDLCRLRPHARLLLMRAGGVIGDRGYFDLRHAESGVKIGDLDEEFVWERSIGDIFPFANRLWRLVDKDARQVKGLPIEGAGGIVPFWRADPADRSEAFGENVLDLMEAYQLHQGVVPSGEGLCCSSQVSFELERLLSEQLKAWGRLPGRKRIVMESHFKHQDDDSSQDELLLFTFRGGRFNRTLALTLEWLHQKKTGGSLQALSNNEGIIFRLSRAEAVVRGLLTELDGLNIPAAIGDLLPSRGLTAAVFREQAQVALMIPRSLPGQRGPLWWRRQRSVDLMEALGRDHRGCILLEGCWRETLDRYFDPASLNTWIQQWRRGDIFLQVSRLPMPSPMAADLIWMHENELMYKAEAGEPRARPSSRFLQNIDTRQEDLPFSASLLERYKMEKWRLLDGMEPDGPDELSLWISERRLIPLPLWNQMMEKLTARRFDGLDDIQKSVIALHGQGDRLLGFADTSRTVEKLKHDPSPAAIAGQLSFLLDWLRFFPFLTLEELSEYWDWTEQDVIQLINQASPEELTVLSGGRVIALPRVVNQLWQRTRLERRLGLKELDPSQFFRFLCRWQERREEPAKEDDHLEEQLFRFSLIPLFLPVWLHLLFPGELERNRMERLQPVLDRTGMLIRGDVRERISFVLPEDLGQLDPQETIPDDESELRVIEKLAAGVGEVSSHDLVMALPGITHHRVLSILKKLFLSGCILCSRLDGVDVVLDQASNLQAVNHSMAAGTVGTRRNRAVARSMSRISRGWRWFSKTEAAASSTLEKLEVHKEWARLLLDRYGILFPELLIHQGFTIESALWRTALSQMEWSGELISGYFVKTARSPQYLLPAAIETFTQTDTMGWRVVHSSEPVSLCGFTAGLFRREFPFSRQFGWLIIENGEWGLAVWNKGKKVRINPLWPRERVQTALGIASNWQKKTGYFGSQGHWIITDVEHENRTGDELIDLMTAVGFQNEMGEWILYQ